MSVPGPPCGFTARTGLYWERLGSGSTTPWVFVHGGGATGAGFRVTPDGRPGWAERLAAAGEVCWVTDWPGSGRSGGRPLLEVHYDDLVEGYVEFLEEVVAEPAIVVCHSMGGPVVWKLVESRPHLIAGVVAVAAAQPGNLDVAAELRADDGTELTAYFPPSGLTFTFRRDRPYQYSDDYLLHQGIASSTHFPWPHLDAFRSSFVAMSPRLVVQRLGFDGGMPRIEHTEAFRDVWIRFVTGSEDPAHTREIDGATIELFRSWGADAELVWLADRGIVGNGHFLFMEDNSDDILALVRAEVETRAARESR